MPKGFLLLLIVAGFITAQPLDSQELPFAGFDRAQSLLHTIHRGLERFRTFWHAAGIPLLADDGGSDGGGSDGGGSDGGSGDGTGDGAGDAASADDAATGSDADDAAASDDAQAPSTDDSDPDANSDATSNVAVVPTDPTVNNAVTPEIAAIEAIATTDPRGGFSPVDIPGTSISGSGLSGTKAPAGPVDVAINAVIVSAAQSPWDAITKANEVRNVIVTGGIIALGKTPIEGEIPGGGPQPTWLRLVPDLRLLNGSIIPPVVPNVIDIRILECPIKALNPSEQD